MPQVLSEADLEELRGIGEIIDLKEVADIYLPLSRLIHLQIRARQKLTAVTETFLGENPGHVPFVIGIAGSVAVGKSTTARVLQVLLQRWESHPRVDLVTTDGFLLSSDELKSRNLMTGRVFRSLTIAAICCALSRKSRLGAGMSRHRCIRMMRMT